MMYFEGLINCETIRDIADDAFRLEEQGKSNAYFELMETYCRNTLDYVEIMDEHQLFADFTFDSLSLLGAAIFFYAFDNQQNGMSLEGSLGFVKEQIAGYVLFTLYNTRVVDGYRGRFELNDDETGLVLIAEDGTEEIMRYDVMDALERAFEYLEIGEQDGGLFVHCEVDEFYAELFRE